MSWFKCGESIVRSKEGLKLTVADKLKACGAVCHIDSGRVEFLD